MRRDQESALYNSGVDWLGMVPNNVVRRCMILPRLEETRKDDIRMEELVMVLALAQAVHYILYFVDPRFEHPIEGPGSSPRTSLRCK
jgi:hypothetical protein